MSINKNIIKLKIGQNSISNPVVKSKYNQTISTSGIQEAFADSNLVDDYFLKGGYKVVSDITCRNNIPCEYRKLGMQVMVVGPDASFKKYVLKGNDPCSNEGWEELTNPTNEVGVKLVEDYSVLGDSLNTQRDLNLKLKQLILNLQTQIDLIELSDEKVQITENTSFANIGQSQKDFNKNASNYKINSDLKNQEQDDRLENLEGENANQNDLINDLFSELQSEKTRNDIQDEVLNNLEGIYYTWSSTSRTLTLFNREGTQLSQVSLVSLDNEGTDLRYNATTLSLELYNEDNVLLDSIPVSSFVGSVGTQLQFNSNQLQLKDSQGNILSTVGFTVSNIQGLQAALDGKQDVLTEDNLGQFMDLELATKSTPTSGDTVLGRDSLTGKAVEIPTSSLGGNGNVDTSNLVPYDNANKDVNIASNYFKTSKGFDFTYDENNYFRVSNNGGYNNLEFQSKDIDNNNIGGIFFSLNPEQGFYISKFDKNKIELNYLSLTQYETYSSKPFVSDVGFKTPTGTPNQSLTANGGVYDLTTKADLVDGKVPSSQLPSYVDDVLEFANLASLPATGESGKIYIAIDTNLTYRWGGSSYVVMSSSLALGETSSTAYRGDRGKIAYDHSQATGNPHGTTKSDIGLGNVENTSDLNKPISTATQTALNNKQDKLTNPITGTGTTNKISKFTANGVIGDSIIYENNNSISIGGITTPGARLDVKAQGALSTDIAFRVRNSTNTQDFLVVTGAGEVYNRGSKGNEFNTFFGEYSGINSTGGSNNAFGRSALASNTTGLANSAFGNNVLQDNTTGDCNNAFGSQSLISNITGNGNNAFGYNALESNTEGNDNIAIGGVALGHNTTGNDNTAVGSNALQDNTTGNQNVALGYGALLSNTTGNQNVSLGVEAGRRLNDGNNSYNTISSNSIYLGYDTRAKANNETNQIVIGHSAIGNGSNTATIGNDSTTDVYLKGITNSNGFKTPTGTPNKALTANGGTFDLNLKLSTEAPSTTGTVISFSTDKVYGTLTTPETGNITADVTNAKLGVTNIIIHNSGIAPTFGSQFKKLSGSGNYATGVVNYIYCTYISATEIIYSINQRT